MAIKRIFRKKKITICIVFLSILFLVIISVRAYRHVQQYLCSVNMCSMASCLHVYMGEYNDKFPTPIQWCDLLKNEAKAPEDTFKCPGAKDGPCTYALNENVFSFYKYGDNIPSDLVFMYEAKPGWNQFGGVELLTTEYHQGRGCHIMFTNLTVEFVKSEKLPSLRWK